MTNEQFLIIACTETILSALIGVIALSKFKEKSIYIKLTGVIFFVGVVCTILSFCLHYLKLGRYSNLPQSFYDILNICLMSYLYYHVTNKKFGTWFLSIALVYVIFFALNILFFQKTGINSYSKFLSSAIIISYCVFYFYQLMVKLPTMHLQRMPMFWINSGFLMYAAGAMFLFAFTTYLTQVLKDNLLVYWSFHNILSIISQLIILVGLIYDFKDLNSSPGAGSQMETANRKSYK